MEILKRILFLLLLTGVVVPASYGMEQNGAPARRTRLARKKSCMELPKREHGETDSAHFKRLKRIAKETQKNVDSDYEEDIDNDDNQRGQKRKRDEEPKIVEINEEEEMFDVNDEVVINMPDAQENQVDNRPKKRQKVELVVDTCKMFIKIPMEVVNATVAMATAIREKIDGVEFLDESGKIIFSCSKKIFEKIKQAIKNHPIVQDLGKGVGCYVVTSAAVTMLSVLNAPIVIPASLLALVGGGFTIYFLGKAAKPMVIKLSESVKAKLTSLFNKS